MPQEEELQTSPEQNKPSVEGLRRAFHLQKRVDWFGEAIEIASRPAEVLNFEPARPDTIAELRRVEAAYRTGLEEALSSMDSLTRKKYDLINQARLQTIEEEDQRATFYLDKNYGLDWNVTSEERFDWKKANPISTDSAQREVGLEMLAERARLSKESWVTLYIYNEAMRPGVQNVAPIKPEAAEDLHRISSSIMAQGNRILGWTTGEERDKAIRINDAVWSFHRAANGAFYWAFETESGEPIFEPLPEPEEKAVIDAEVQQPTELEFHERECQTCGTTFKSTHSEGPCYSCALDSITHGLPPEEGDFNSARIISGTLTAEERRYLQEDLESVESV